MQEYWVNVYDFSKAEPDSKYPYSFSQPFTSKLAAISDYIDWGGAWRQIPIYRIHVKMKAAKGSDMEKRMYNGAIEFGHAVRDIMNSYRSGY